MNELERREALGPAERLIQTITKHVDHAVHNRPGVVVLDPRQPAGVRWDAAIWVKEGEQKIVYRVTGGGRGKKPVKTRIGVLDANGHSVMDAGRLVGSFRDPGVFPEVAVFLYNQIAEVWRTDNEFAAKWASHAFANESNRDLRVLLVAFLLVQSRFGEPVKDGDETLFDADYREVGEAMCLIHSKKKGATFNARQLLRVGDVLALPGVAEINRKLGFGQSAREPVMGRYYKVIEKWLEHREANIKLLENDVKEGHRRSIMALARKVGYKPRSEAFFELLRWKQVQSKAGHRKLAIGKDVKQSESKGWEDLNERQICEKIAAEKPSYKRLVGMLKTGLTPAIMAAAVESGCLSDAEMVILTPTLEELGLLNGTGPVAARWKTATERAENQRAANIARNVKSEKVKETLQASADLASQKAVAEVAKDFRIYVIIDRSGSMQGAIDRAKECVSKLVTAFPLERLHVCVFNTIGTEVKIEKASSTAVAMAFRGLQANGGTSYAAGAHCLLRDHKPQPNEDALLIFVGDEDDPNVVPLVQVIQQHHGVKPAALGLLHVDSGPNAPRWLRPDQATIIRQAAGMLGIPCLEIDEQVFADPYAVPRVLRNLISSTPVRKVEMGYVAPIPTASLIDQILKTPLLRKPAWA